MVHIIHLRTSLNQRTDFFNWPLDGPRNLVDVLRLDHRLEIIFQNLSEVVYRVLVLCI
jgi:hypothetical protein